MEKCRRSARQLVFVALLAIPLGLGAVRALADEGPDPLGPLFGIFGSFVPVRRPITANSTGE